MARLVLSDASPLISLAQIDGLRWLITLFGHVHITQEVHDEILTGRGKPGEEALARAIEQRQLLVHREWNWPEPQFPSLGKGEASCLRAMVNLQGRGHECLLLMDDLAARRIASSATIPVSGTVAIAGAAKEAGLVSSVRAVIDMFLANGARISPAIVHEILARVGEAQALPPKPTPREKKSAVRKRRL